MTSFKPEVKTPGDTTWAGNALRFATREEAEVYVADLSMRWLAVTDTRVVESDEPVNYTCLRNADGVRELKALPEATVVGPYSPLPREDDEDGPVVILPTDGELDRPVS